MKKLYISFIIIFVILCMPFLRVEAFNINMDLPDNTEETNTSYNEEENNVETNSLSNSNASTANTSSVSNPQITVTSARDNEFLTIENILSIIIIVIGIILIFLGIAIMIRCK